MGRDQTIALRIKQQRDVLGLTQKSLADLVGVHLVTVNRWEKGGHLPEKHLSKLAEALGLTADQLLYGDDPSRNDVNIKTSIQRNYNDIGKVINQLMESIQRLEKEHPWLVDRDVQALTDEQKPDAKHSKSSKKQKTKKPELAIYTPERHRILYLPQPDEDPSKVVVMEYRESLSAGWGKMLSDEPEGYIEIGGVPPGIRLWAFRVSGDSMEPTFEDDSIIVCQPQGQDDQGFTLPELDPERSPAPLDLMKRIVPHHSAWIVRFNDEEPTLKRVEYATGGRVPWYLRILADNPTTPGYPRIVKAEDKIQFFARVYGVIDGDPQILDWSTRARRHESGTA